ncbi:MAG: EAL domain-containing protein [Ahniella sp.]|nr:EAL domain-containing protein [Ahniella sp.]
MSHEIAGEIRAADGGSVAVLLLRLRRYRQEHILFDNFLNETVTERVKQSLRPEDRVFEIGENRFALLLPGVRGSNHAQLAANRLVRSFVEPINNGVQQVQVMPTIGIAVYPDHGDTGEQLLDGAESAFEQASLSNDRYALAQINGRRRSISYDALRDAIQQNRLEVNFQPIWNMRTNRLFGAESLARWSHPEFGEVNPTEFVLLAEQTGLITGFTRWSLNGTLRHCASALARNPDLHFAINLSPRVFHDPGVVEQINGAAQIWEVPSDRIVLEVTESAVMEDAEISARVLHRLREIGFGIAIDDFGIGYSTYSYLKRFPATELKIDQSFVRDLAVDPRSANLVRSMVELGHSLMMRVVAEGVETPELAKLLGDMGCDLAQGYWFGAPVTAEVFIKGLPDSSG